MVTCERPRLVGRLKLAVQDPVPNTRSSVPIRSIRWVSIQTIRPVAGVRLRSDLEHLSADLLVRPGRRRRNRSTTLPSLRIPVVGMNPFANVSHGHPDHRPAEDGWADNIHNHQLGLK